MTKFFASSNATLTLVLLALLAQLPHTAALVHRLAPVSTTDELRIAWFLSWLHAYIYAIALEGGILLLVVRGRHVWSWVFAGASVLVNIGYYWQSGWTIDAITDDMLRAGLVSLMLPLAIALYSHEIAGPETQSGERQPHPKAPSIYEAVDLDFAPPAQLPWEQLTPLPLTPMATQSEPSIAPASMPKEEQSTEGVERNAVSAKERAFQLLDVDSDIGVDALVKELNISPGSAKTYRSEWRKQRQLTLAVNGNGVAH